MSKDESSTGRRPFADAPFTFACGADVSCYTACCHKLELRLYPYDILRLKNYLGIGSEEFLNRYTGIVKGDNPCFPTLILVMGDDEDKSCPFLSVEGCTVYNHRPSACRTYPLERGVEKRDASTRLLEHWFVVTHPYCKGHGLGREWSVKKWVKDQGLAGYNQMNDLWAEMDHLFADHRIWAGEGAAGPRQKMAFLACYNLDRFREYVDENRILEQFRIDKGRKKVIMTDDEALLVFAFDWLKMVLAGIPTLTPRKTK